MVQAVEVNTSLGTILLLAPIALCSLNSTGWNPKDFQESIASVLEDSTPEDSRLIYQAIRIANPGGLGQVANQDVQSTPPESILEAMRIASAWDDVALQYANGFRQVSQWTDRLLAILESSSDLLGAVRLLQIEILASRPDSLIARKHGEQVAGLVQSQAADVLASGPYASPEFEKAWSCFDGYLRENGHRKNPGTTADLLAAVIFLARCAQDRFDG
jgi:triphosphoribosyl-dephospho-CoA synthase